VSADTFPQTIPANTMTGTKSASEEVPSRRPVAGWPRWAAAVLTASGLVVIVAETTSLLLFAGLLLVAFGTYGFVAGARARSLERAADRSSSRTREQEVSTYGS
jgi:hypothetical protein